jgi:hypothetical protein
MAIDWNTNINGYEDKVIDIIDEYSRIHSTRHSSKIYFDDRYSEEFYIDWKVELPENCEEIIQISFDNKDTWITLSEGSPEDRPITIERPIDYEDYLILREVLVINDIQLLNIEERPKLDWLLIEDDYTPLPCHPKMKISVNEEEYGANMIICYDDRDFDIRLINNKTQAIS